jgi:predicted transcriptional regulator
MRLAVTGNPLKKLKRVRTLSTEQRRLLELLLEEPGSTLAELTAEGVYDCTQNVERALSGLISRGLITFTHGQQPSYTLTYPAKKLLASSSG